MKRFFLIAAASSVLFAQGLTLTVGNSVAGQDYMMKNAAFVFRVNGCVDLSKVSVSATAEGLVADMRRSVPLTLPPSQSNGIYAVRPQWGNEGKWIVVVAVTCLSQTAGAIVPVARDGFVRESTQLLQRSATQDQIEAALKAWTPPATLR